MDEAPLAICGRKRAFDIVIVLLTSPLWVPAMVMCSLAILVFSGTPILYWSRRRVARGVTVPVAKFRTMIRDAESVANRNTIPVDAQRFLNISLASPLYTRIGRLIERFHLTETPQFVHVLTGKLSLVGNRPLPEDVIGSLRQAHPDAEDRFDVRSGMTGPVQLIGRSDISDADRLSIERKYCQVASTSYSIRLDMFILGMTVPVALGILPPRSVDEVREMLHATAVRVKARSSAETDTVA